MIFYHIMYPIQSNMDLTLNLSVFYGGLYITYVLKCNNHDTIKKKPYLRDLFQCYLLH